MSGPVTVYAAPGSAAAKALSVCKAVAGAKMAGAVHVASAYDGDDVLAKSSAATSSAVPVAVTSQGTVAGFATALRLAAAGSTILPTDPLPKARCDQILDIAAELASAAAAGDTSVIRPLVSRAEIGLVGGAKVGAGATVGDVALAAALCDAEKVMAAAGAQPALMSRTAAYLRGWEATKEWSSA